MYNKNSVLSNDIKHLLFTSSEATKLNTLYSAPNIIVYLLKIVKL